jgi:carbon storage regulator
MLVLARRLNQDIVLTVQGIEIIVKVVRLPGDKVHLGIEAPTEVRIHRREIHELIERQKISA